jgi:hypothetical protein
MDLNNLNKIVSVYVSTQEESVALQQILFSYGYKWGVTYSNIPASYIYKTWINIGVDVDGIITPLLMYSKDWFYETKYLYDEFVTMLRINKIDNVLNS